MTFDEKVRSLFQYRNALDEEDREVFDLLIEGAWEMAQ